MSRPGLQNLRPWKKGQSGNPSGITKLPPELLLIKPLTPLKVARIIAKYAEMPYRDLKLVVEDDSMSTLDIAVAHIFWRAIYEKDHLKLSFLLDRCIGKVKDMQEDEEEIDARESLKRLSMHELLTIVKNNLPDKKEANEEDHAHIEES